MSGNEEMNRHDRVRHSKVKNVNEGHCQDGKKQEETGGTGRRSEEEEE